MKVNLTMIMRIKFTGLPHINYIMEFCAHSKKDHAKIYGHNVAFLCRINEEEGKIIDFPRRSGTVKFTKSGDYDEFYKNNPIEPDVKADML